MSQNMNGFPGLREAALAVTLTALATVGSGCSERTGPNPPIPSIETPTEQANSQNICDVTTRERVAKFLRLAPGDELSEGDCVSDRDSGITAYQSWRVDDGPLKGLTIASFTTDESAAGPSDFSFENLFSAVPGSQAWCTTPVDILDIKHNGCLNTDDSAGILLDDKAVFTQLGYRDKFAPLTAENIMRESFGDQLMAFSAASAEQLVQPPQSTAKGKQPAPTDLSDIFRPGKTDPDTPALPATYSYAPCALYDDAPHTCASLDPNVEVGFVNYSDTTGCTFEGTIDFGDGRTVAYTTPGTIPGRVKLQDHQYENPGNYSVKMTAESKGGCTAYGVEFVFTKQQQPTPATCANKLDEDRGRAYLYSMLPSGSLSRPNGETANPFVYDETVPENNLYVDAAGVKWYLLPENKSKHHQPAGWDSVENEGEAPYRKFVSETDSSGGSFEAVLMPDGATAITTYQQLSGKSLTYSQNNWLTYGNGMPAYDLVTPTPVGSVTSSVNAWHLVSDVLPHEFDADSELGDGRYVAPDHFINPVTDNWRTYRERMHGIRQLIDAGYRLNPQNNHLETIGASQPLDQDLLGAARMIIDCAK